MKIGILRETKDPPDRRVALTPDHCRELEEKYKNIKIIVQPSNFRAYSDEEYLLEGIEVNEDISDCTILLGVKEVKETALKKNKTYLFFSHTAKKQTHNRELLKSILTKQIRLIDYEYLTDDNNIRVVAFGRWAGIVGAYNALIACGKRKQLFTLKPAWQCKDSNEIFEQVRAISPDSKKILITGGGRVARGAIEILYEAGIRQVPVNDFLTNEYREPVFAQIDPEHYVKHKDDRPFNLGHFFANPQDYSSTFMPFTRVTDVLIACHYWDPLSPFFFTRQEMMNEDFHIKIIADVSCDIPGPIPSTLRSSSIDAPFYGYSPETGKESDPWSGRNITVMAVDNLPGELPRDASTDFGRKLMDEVIPYLLQEKEGLIIERATIAANGNLTERFRYLENFVNGNE